MKKIYTSIVLVAVLLAAIIIFASRAKADPYIQPGKLQHNIALKVVDGTSLSTNPEFTSKINVGGYNQASVYVNYTYGAATAVKMTCYSFIWNSSTKLMDGSSYTLQVIDPVDPSALASQDMVFNKAISAASAKWVWNFRLNYSYITCKFTNTGATSDLITAYLVLGGI